METISDSQTIKQFAKLCKNGCGKLIKWDTSQNKYFEIDTNERHRCPNWNPKQEYFPDNVNTKITQEQQLYVDTIGPAIAEILSLLAKSFHYYRKFVSTLFWKVTKRDE